MKIGSRSRGGGGGGKITERYHPKETKIGSRNRQMREIGGKNYREVLSKGNETWFEKSGGLRNRAFERLGAKLQRSIIQGKGKLVREIRIPL